MDMSISPKALSYVNPPFLLSDGQTYSTFGWTGKSADSDPSLSYVTTEPFKMAKCEDEVQHIRVGPLSALVEYNAAVMTGHSHGGFRVRRWHRRESSVAKEV